MSRAEAVFRSDFLEGEWDCFEPGPQGNDWQPDERTEAVVAPAHALASSSRWIVPVLTVFSALATVDAQAGPNFEHRSRSCTVTVADVANDPDETRAASTRQWNEYLDRLSEHPDEVSPTALGTIRALWTKLRSELPSLPIPAAEPVETGVFQLVWDRDRVHVDLDVLNDGTFEWFYRDRQTGVTAGHEGCTLDAVPNELIAFLAMLA